MDYKEYPADLADERREKSAKISAISGRKNVNHKSLPQISRITAEKYHNLLKSAQSAGEKT